MGQAYAFICLFLDSGFLTVRARVRATWKQIYFTYGAGLVVGLVVVCVMYVKGYVDLVDVASNPKVYSAGLKAFVTTLWMTLMCVCLGTGLSKLPRQVYPGSPEDAITRAQAQFLRVSEQIDSASEAYFAAWEKLEIKRLKLAKDDPHRELLATLSYDEYILSVYADRIARGEVGKIRDGGGGGLKAALGGAKGRAKGAQRERLRSKVALTPSAIHAMEARVDELYAADVQVQIEEGHSGEKHKETKAEKKERKLKKVTQKSHAKLAALRVKLNNAKVDHNQLEETLVGVQDELLALQQWDADDSDHSLERSLRRKRVLSWLFRLMSAAIMQSMLVGPWLPGWAVVRLAVTAGGPYWVMATSFTFVLYIFVAVRDTLHGMNFRIIRLYHLRWHHNSVPKSVIQQAGWALSMVSPRYICSYRLRLLLPLLPASKD